ncbi:MAG: GDSL family lipase [Clostridia bacterium]|nr:GDSL family lipase [Clostridia bacterium]
MKITKKLAQKAADNAHTEGVTIAFLGDSVTQGCFELYKKEGNVIETVFDKRHSYEAYVFDAFCVLYPTVTINIINAGISGDNAKSGAGRVERDVLRHNPDLTVVCYGLNDCGNEEGRLDTYLSSLSNIFDRLKSNGSEIIFMTPNMMNTKISVHLKDKDYIDIANRTASLQNDGVFDLFIDEAKKLCTENNIPVCDCYAVWKNLYNCGVDTTELLANKINHPTREMNKLFAYELIKTIFDCEE